MFIQSRRNFFRTWSTSSRYGYLSDKDLGDYFLTKFEEEYNTANVYKVIKAYETTKDKVIDC